MECIETPYSISVFLTIFSIGFYLYNIAAYSICIHDGGRVLKVKRWEWLLIAVFNGLALATKGYLINIASVLLLLEITSPFRMFKKILSFHEIDNNIT